MLGVIFALAGPTIFEQFMQTAVQYIDTAMVGSLGTSATAAVGATTTVNWLVGSTVSAVGVGFLSYIAKKHGSGDLSAVRRASAQSVLAVLVTGIFFTVLTLSLSSVVPVLMQVDEPIRELAAEYFFILYTPMLARAATIIFGTVLRAVGDTKTPMYAGIAVNIVNVVLNFLLIYPTREIFGITVPGADMGVTGAAVASAVGFTVGGIIISVTLWCHPLLSPKKTVEGAIGGFSATIAAMVVYGFVLKALDFNVNFIMLIIYGFFGSAACQLGDLSFSAIKRLYGVKDYGRILPGHGGMLDRFDSTFWTAVMVDILVSWLPAFDKIV